MKRLLSVVLVGTMVAAMALPVSASGSPSSSGSSCSGPSCGSSSAPVEAAPSSEEVTGFSAPVVAAAAAVGKTPAEYVNNAIVSTPGLEGVKTMPMGQGGNITVNGVKSRHAFIINKVTRPVAAQALAQAQAQGAQLLNVCFTSSINMPAFTEAVVPFYMKGLTADSKILVLRKTATGWEPMIAAARADHIDVVMNQHETLLFLLLP